MKFASHLLLLGTLACAAASSLEMYDADTGTTIATIAHKGKYEVDLEHHPRLGFTYNASHFFPGAVSVKFKVGDSKYCSTSEPFSIEESDRRDFIDESGKVVVMAMVYGEDRCRGPRHHKSKYAFKLDVFGGAMAQTMSPVPTEPPIAPTSAPAPQTVRNCPDDIGEDANGFNMCLDLVVEPRDEALFVKARDTWQSKISGDIDPVKGSKLSIHYGCTSYPKVIDDMYLCGKYSSLDGSGRILGYASPQYARSKGENMGLPISGLMVFDESDVDGLRQSGLLEAIITHEMGHIMGIGTMWYYSGLTWSTGGKCMYSGPAANAAYEAVTGCSSVPMEWDGESGTRCVHWDEECLGHELMTGFVSGSEQPLTKLTVAGLEDLGYTVNYANTPDFDVNPTCSCQVGGAAAKSFLGDASTMLRGKLGLSSKASEAPKTLSGDKKPLSPSLEESAKEYGKNLLLENRDRRLTAADDEDPDTLYVGDRFVSIVVKEGENVYTVGVTL